MWRTFARSFRIEGRDLHQHARTPAFPRRHPAPVSRQDRLPAITRSGGLAAATNLHRPHTRAAMSSFHTRRTPAPAADPMWRTFARMNRRQERNLRRVRTSPSGAPPMTTTSATTHDHDRLACTTGPCGRFIPTTKRKTQDDHPPSPDDRLTPQMITLSTPSPLHRSRHGAMLTTDRRRRDSTSPPPPIAIRSPH